MKIAATQTRPPLCGCPRSSSVVGTGGNRQAIAQQSTRPVFRPVSRELVQSCPTPLVSRLFLDRPLIFNDLREKQYLAVPIVCLLLPELWDSTLEA